MYDAELVKSKIDLVEIISEYLPLKKAGRNLKAACPFHTETNPSFMVSPDLGIWRCFGCDRGGDVFSFLEEKEGMSFVEALEYLAKRVGVKLQKRVGGQEDKKNKLYQINSQASQLFHYLLTKHRIGQKALSYLSARNVSSSAIEKFELGYAPASWDTLLRFLSRKFDLSDIASTGLLVGKETGGYYDRFRGRIIFPIKSPSAEVIGFSGRVLKEAADEPKYINTPETAIFSKGRILYGLDLARGEIKKKNEAILVEGELDVIASFEAKVENTVATKGTALTEGQVGLLSRLCDNIALCFDTDLAGDAAARRGVELADQAGLNIKVIQLDQAKDPDELIAKSKSLWQEAVNRAIPVFDFLIDSALRRFDQSTAAGKKEIAGELLPILAKISDEVVKAHYLAKLASQLEVSEEVLRQALLKKIRVEKFAKEPESQIAKSKVFGLIRRDRLEGYLLALIWQAGDFEVDKKILPNLGDFQNQSLKNLYKMFMIRSAAEESKKPDFSGLSQRERELFEQLNLVDLSAAVEGQENWQKEVKKTAQAITCESLKEKLRILGQKIVQAQKAHQEKKLTDLRRQFRDLSEKLAGI